MPDKTVKIAFKLVKETAKPVKRRDLPADFWDNPAKYVERKRAGNDE